MSGPPREMHRKAVENGSAAPRVAPAGRGRAPAPPIGPRIARWIALRLKGLVRAPARRVRRFLTAELRADIADLRTAQVLAAEALRHGSVRGNGAVFEPGRMPERGRLTAPWRRRVHQFHSGSAPGDAITNAMLLMQRLLRSLGYESEIFVEFRDPALAGDLRLIDDLPVRDDYVLIVHHSMGHDAFDRIASLPAPKILVYHNITPPTLLEDAPWAQSYAAKGREQLRLWRERVVMALADSAFNLLELFEEGYAAAAECPILFDIAALEQRAKAVQARPDDNRPFTVLFVGRIMAAKGQAELVEAFVEFRKALGKPCRLVLIGRFESGSDGHAAEVRAQVARHRLGDSVLLTGWLSDAELDAWYAAADLYVSLSRHEGFGVPLIEAMAFRVPVLAWPAGAVPYTIGDAGVTLTERSAPAVAAAMLRLANYPEARAEQVRRQAATLDRFRLEHQLPALTTALAAAGARPPISASTRGRVEANLRFAVTGHFNKTYSLAAINRSLALALEEARPGMVRVLPVEGGPTDHLEEVPVAERAAIVRLARRGLPASGPEVAISQHYPIHVPIGPYDLKLALLAWEESLLPAPMIATLSGGFDGVLAPTQFVAKALIDSGLSIPVIAVGQAVDIGGYAAIAAGRGAASAPALTRFLHVSSGFPRKGADILLRAYARAFRRGDPVRLVIKVFPNPHNDIAEQIAALRSRDPDCADIELIDRDISETEMLALYREADVMVLPTRGEGFNLPALEAMTAGLPLIVTGFGGHQDFCGPAEARQIGYRFVRSQSHVAASHGLWVEPDEDDLVAGLREMCDPAGRERARQRAEKAQAAATRAADRGAWCARIAAAATALLLERQLGRGRIVWVSSWNVRCGIAEYSARLLEHVAALNEHMTILCDERTSVGAPAVGMPSVRAAWRAGAAESVPDLARAIAEEDPAAVVIQHQPGLIPWKGLARLLTDPRVAGRIVLIVLHSLEDLFTLREGERQELFAALGSASRVLVHRLGDLNRLHAAGAAENLTLLPHGAAAPRSAPLVRELPETAAPMLGCHGFFMPHKGIRDLIEALPRLVAVWPELRLRLLNAEYPIEASTAEIGRCRALAEALGVAERIEWYTEFLPIGRVSDLLRGCDLIVLPYRESEESASGALRTALASLVPLAVTNVSIFEEVEGAAAWLTPEDPPRLAEEIRALLADRAQREALQGAAAAWLAMHDWGRTAERLSGMIQGLIAERRVAAAMTRVS